MERQSNFMLERDKEKIKAEPNLSFSILAVEAWLNTIGNWLKDQLLEVVKENSNQGKPYKTVGVSIRFLTDEEISKMKSPSGKSDQQEKV